MINLERVIAELQAYQGPELKIMEVCGTHTASIAAHAIRSLISDKIKLISGPGCPVCVTTAGYIDAGLALARKPGHVLLTFSDMLRVPGSRISLAESRTTGAHVETMYSPLEAIQRAEDEPENTIVVAAVGFETTVPAYCELLALAREKNIRNIRLHCAIRLITPALNWIGESQPDIQGFLCPGHVSAIIGSEIYGPFARRFNKPCAVAGFSAQHLLVAIYDLVKQVQEGRAEVHNLYPSVVKPAGNEKALAAIHRYFRPGKASWRGLGVIEDSGLYLRPEYQEFAEGMPDGEVEPQTGENRLCRCGEVITGRINPVECPNFGLACTPQSPQGPCMVSAEGSCGIWFTHRITL